MYMAQHTVDVEKQLRRRKKGFACCSLTLGPFPAFHERVVGASGGWERYSESCAECYGADKPSEGL